MIYGVSVRYLAPGWVVSLKDGSLGANGDTIDAAFEALRLAIAARGDNVPFSLVIA